MSQDSLHMIAGVVLTLVPMILSLTVHEFAHAWAAKRLGDTTAEDMGRLTLNPIAHIDPIGTLLLPVLLMSRGLPWFGWARPVPFNPARFTRKVNMRTGAMLVAAAGPASNLVMAVLCVAGLAALVHAGVAARAPEALLLLLQRMVQLNIGLFVFNMIPVAPLDGQKVLGGFLRGNAAIAFDRFNARFGWIALIAIIALPQTSALLAAPVIFIYTGLWSGFGLG